MGLRLKWIGEHGGRVRAGGAHRPWDVHPWKGMDTCIFFLWASCVSAGASFSRPILRCPFLALVFVFLDFLFLYLHDVGQFLVANYSYKGCCSTRLV